MLNRKGINDPFLRRCYELRMLPTELPIWIGLPVRFAKSFREHACEWQLAFIHYMKQQHIGFNQLTEREIRKFRTAIEDSSADQVKACLALS